MLVVGVGRLDLEPLPDERLEPVIVHYSTNPLLVDRHADPPLQMLVKAAVPVKRELRLDLLDEVPRLGISPGLLHRVYLGFVVVAADREPYGFASF